MINTYDVDGWSPRVHHIKQLDGEWDIGENTTLESVMSALDVLEEIIDDYKAFKAAQRPKAAQPPKPIALPRSASATYDEGF